MYFYKFNISNIDKCTKIINDIIKNIRPEDETTCSYKSTQKGTQYNLKHFVHYFHDILFCIEECIKSCLNCSVKLESIWTIIGEHGTYHTIHRHSKYIDKVSVVLYLQVPSEQVSPEGSIYFFDDNADNYSKSIKIVTPKIGDLIIFPSSIFHGTYPQGHGTRQTLNMDFSIKGA
jgi:hypothetical protein